MSTPQRVLFQFSIRELLLGLTACGALLSLVLQNVHHWFPWDGTRLTRDFHLHQILNEVAASQGLAPLAVTSSVGIDDGGGHAGSGSSSRRTSCSYPFRIPQKDRANIFDAFQKEMVEMMSESRCAIISHKGGSQSFYSTYENDGLFGVVRVEMRDDAVNPRDVHFRYFAVEFRK